ncbi:hypothetical protein FM104_02545 [Microbacterium esteraromaticum]|uniref:Antitoxin FitA-like ribbon-helix-helix domain-containing protein n=1 Tax=Microbacterium esteraromaticum TaxID=57043 RepID=A0A1R4IKB4_9MICO|nr:Arc family DNA-binding protein [Microbacterium esteraromaticum]SJN20125.1 hypothetical protein FM104_02545 [Microbacterium esteraromaticum]
MAAVTIRNLSDEVVDALKKRAKRNGRSMEAEIREALMRLAADNDSRSGLEERLDREHGRGRWYTTGAEINARIAANPRTEEDRRVAEEWLDEYNARPYDEEPFRDPWEHAERLRREQGQQERR